MKKNVSFLLLALFLFSNIMKIDAQVTIGENTVPHPGAALELRTTKGFLLSKASLADADVFQLSAEKAEEAVGMLVYNTNPNMTKGTGKGVYVWDGKRWTKLVDNSIPVKKITVTSSSDNVVSGGFALLTALVEPDNATDKTYTWSVIQDSGTGVITASGVFVAGLPGTVKIRATAEDGSGVYGEKEITVLPATGNTTPPSQPGHSYKTYCYPNHIGCWMISNSVENEPMATYLAYNRYPAGERGYYYSTYAALSKNLCPSEYHLPSDSEWQRLQTYINGSESTPAEKEHWFGSEACGGTYIPSYDRKWFGWDAHGYWWSNSGAVWYTESGRIIRASDYSNRHLSVRCVKSN